MRAEGGTLEYLRLFLSQRMNKKGQSFARRVPDAVEFAHGTFVFLTEVLVELGIMWEYYRVSILLRLDQAVGVCRQCS